MTAQTKTQTKRKVATKTNTSKPKGAVAPPTPNRRPRRHSADIPPKAPTNDLTLVEVSKEGDRLTTLRALRDELSKALPGAHPRDKAPLAKELRTCMEEIETIENLKPEKYEERPINVIKMRAAERSAGAKNKARA